MTATAVNPAIQATLDDMFLTAHVLSSLDPLLDGIEHPLCDGTDTGMTVTGRLGQKGVGI